MDLALGFGEVGGGGRLARPSGHIKVYIYIYVYISFLHVIQL